MAIKKICCFTMVLAIIVLLGSYYVSASDYAYDQRFNYPEGDFASGTDGFSFTHNAQGTSYVKIAKEDNDNTYLSIGKSANQNGYSVSRDFADIVAPLSNYIIEFKLKLNVTTNNTSFNFSDGAYFSVGKNIGASQSSLEYYNGTGWITYNSTFDLSDWCTFKMYVNTKKNTVDLYINNELVISDVPKRYASATLGKFTVAVNNSVIGSWDMDDLRIIGIASCSNENYAYDDTIDFEDFGAGSLTSGTGGISFDNTSVGTSVNIEYDAQAQNKYLTVNKAEAGSAFIVQRPYNSVISEYSSYMVDYRFKINGDGLFNISDNLNFNNDGLSLNINTNGTVSYVEDGSNTETQLSQNVALNNWYNVKYVIHKASGTADLYFEGSLIKRGIPAKNSSEFGALVLTADSSTIGSISIDDIIIREYGLYTGIDWQQESDIDFQNFTKGYIASGEGGIEFAENYKAGSFAKIEYDEESNNKYLALQKNTTDISFSAKRTYTSLVESWAEYAVSFKFKLNGVGNYNIAESSGTYNRGILINIAQDGTLKYYAGEGAPGASADGYITISDKLDLSNWVEVKFVINSTTKTGDIYVNDSLIAYGTPSRGSVDLGGLCITANNSVLGSLLIDDINILKVNNYIQSNELLIDLRTIHGYKGLTVSTITDVLELANGVSVRILDGSGEATGIITKGMVLEANHVSGDTQLYTFGEEASIINDIYYTFNGFITDGNFGIGEITVHYSFENYQPSTELCLIIAQYEGNELINVSFERKIYISNNTITAKLNIEKSSGTKVKVMLWDGNLEPLKGVVPLEPYADDYGTPTVAQENFDVFLAIGQSNMAGRAEIEDEDKAPIPGAYLFNSDSEWELAQVQYVNSRWRGFNRYSTVKSDEKYQGLNPAVYFAKTLTEVLSNTGREIGIVSNARGDTSIEQWQKGYAGTNDYNLYEEAVARASLAQESGNLKGIIWHQGCANVNSTDYNEKFIQLINDFRSDLDAPNLPVIVGEIPGFGESEAKSNARMLFNRSFLKELPNYVQNCYFISAAGSRDKGDKTHFDSKAQRSLGKSYAKSALINIYGITQPQKDIINITSIEASSGSLNADAAKDGIASIYTWDTENTYWSAPIGSYWIAQFEGDKIVSEIKSYFRNPWNYTYQYKIYTKLNDEWTLAVDNSQTYHYENISLDGCIIDVLDNVLADAVKIEVIGLCDIDGNSITSGSMPAACHEFEFR